MTADPQTHAIVQAREATQAIDRQISEEYSLLCANSVTAKDVTIRMANRARKIGSLLIARKAASQRDFSKLFTSDGDGARNLNPSYGFTYHWGRIFMRISEAFPDEITDLRDGLTSLRAILASAGELEIETTQQQARGSLNPSSHILRWRISGFAILGKEKEKRGDYPLWDKTELCLVRDEMRPIAEEFAQIVDAIGCE